MTPYVLLALVLSLLSGLVAAWHAHLRHRALALSVRRVERFRGMLERKDEQDRQRNARLRSLEVATSRNSTALERHAGRLARLASQTRLHDQQLDSLVHLVVDENVPEEFVQTRRFQR